MATFWNVALWVYEFSAILCFLLLVKLTFRLSKEINDQLDIDFFVNDRLDYIYSQKVFILILLGFCSLEIGYYFCAFFTDGQPSLLDRLPLISASASPAS